MTCIGGLHIPKTGSVLLTAEEAKEVEDHIDQLKAENAKLRELVREMYATISDRNSWWDCTYKDTRRFAHRIRDLGIEVGE